MSKEQNDNRLPIIQFDGGEHSDRLVQGAILKCVDSRWDAHDGTPLNEEDQYYVFGMTKGLQHWQDGRVIEEIKKKLGVSLPDVNELNAAIPQEDWEVGIDGKVRPPWQLNDVVYLLRVRDAMKFTYLNSTIGARIAAARLLDRIQSMQMLRGRNVIPVVTLGNRPMKTAYGQKLRPHFEIVQWRDLGEPAPVVPPPQSSPLIGKSVDPAKIGTPMAEPTSREELNDTIGF
jgi:hypothetical protein